MGRKAKHELEARLQMLERAAERWGAGNGEEAFRALSGRNFSWEAVGDFLERVDATDLTLDAASTLAECAERWQRTHGLYLSGPSRPSLASAFDAARGEPSFDGGFEPSPIMSHACWR